jgi:hypothetical protein
MTASTAPAFHEPRRDLLTAVIQANIQILQQARDILRRIDGRTYRDPAPCNSPIRIGAHLRHVIEFYDCLLSGIGAGVVDYDSRRRDRQIEQDAICGLAALDAIASRLAGMPHLQADLPLMVRAEDSDPGSLPLSSTLGREMQAVLTHTIHHFALIAVAHRAVGVPVDPGFGVSPATLRFRAAEAA